MIYELYKNRKTELTLYHGFFFLDVVVVVDDDDDDFSCDVSLTGFNGKILFELSLDDDFLFIWSFGLLINIDWLFVVLSFIEDNSDSFNINEERFSVLADLTGSLLFLLWSIRRCFVCKCDNDEEFNSSIDSLCSNDKSELNDGDVITTIVELFVSIFEQFSIISLLKLFSFSLLTASNGNVFNCWFSSDNVEHINLTWSDSSIGLWAIGEFSIGELKNSLINYKRKRISLLILNSIKLINEQQFYLSRFILLAIILSSVGREAIRRCTKFFIFDTTSLLFYAKK